MSNATPEVDDALGDEVEQDIDRREGYNNEAASEIQTSIADLQGSSEEIVDEVDEQTERIEGIDRAVGKLVGEL